MSAQWFAASRVLFVAGKGGVGKTTVGASIAVAAARTGADVLVVELEGRGNLAARFGRTEASYDEVEVAAEWMDPDLTGPNWGRIRFRQLSPDDALTDYLDGAGLGFLTRQLTRTGAIEVVASAAPGIRDLLTLGKIRQLEQAEVADLIIVDAPAAGHAVTFLTSPAGLAASTSSGPVRDQADRVLELFADDSRCQVSLVTLAEETPVLETIETAFALEDDVGLKLAPVVVNGLWPPVDGLADAVAAADTAAGATAAGATAAGASGDDDPGLAAGRYRLARIAAQRSEVDRLTAELPLPWVELPFLFTTTVGSSEVGALASVLAGVPNHAGPGR